MSEQTPCPATAPSRALEGHTHACSGTHQDGMHKCAVMMCRRWFGAPLHLTADDPALRRILARGGPR